MPKAMRQRSEITGIELEPLSAQITNTLHPDIRILNQGFQNFHENGFDLIIGNPPYANFNVFDSEHPDLSRQMIHHYFAAKSARLLKEKGILAMVLPSYILDNPKKHLRNEIAEQAQLLTAYRLPNNLFSDAKITVDIAVFQKQVSLNQEWTKAIKAKLANDEYFYISQYFIENPGHVLGELGTYTIPATEKWPERRGLQCTESDKPFNEQLKQLISKLKTTQ
jgi:adenine-specific DNA methylase